MTVRSIPQWLTRREKERERERERERVFVRYDTHAVDARQMEM